MVEATGNGKDGNRGDGRNTSGQFVKGIQLYDVPTPGPRITAAMRVRNAIIESFHRIDSDALLERVANEDPVAYLNVVLKALPKEQKLQAVAIFANAFATSRQSRFVESVNELAQRRGVVPNASLALELLGAVEVRDGD